ncbi:MAG: HAD family hydrolase [Aggregatilineales bacterium]
MLKAILFDLDDTLIDWSHFSSNWEEVESRHLSGLYTFLCDTIQPFSTKDNFTEGYIQRTREAWSNARTTLIAPHLGRIIIETASALGIPAEMLDEKACLKAYQWGAVPGTSPFPDVIESLTLLRERGLRMGIVTNAFQPMWMRDEEMNQHGLLEFFPECRFSAADVGRLKPHADIFATALNCLDLPPEEVVFIGDNPTADVAGAQSAGMNAILRSKRSTRSYKKGLVVPDGTIDSLKQLPPILDALYPGWGNG